MELLALIIIAIAVIVLFIQKENNRPENKGKRGEEEVIYAIGETIPEKQYIINNIYLKDQNGKTCQIDHIVINKNGVFVIETKNYSGRIYGKDNQQYWTQTLKYKNRRAKKFKFYNPIKQNATHIYMLRKITATKLPIKSIVVFTQDNIEYIESENVYTIWKMKSVIGTPQGPEITKEEMKILYDKIIGSKNTNQNQEQEHLKNIYQQQNKIETNICPRCGGRLKKRSGKYGSFYGCSNYPKCRFTKK